MICYVNVEYKILTMSGFCILLSDLFLIALGILFKNRFCFF